MTEVDEQGRPQPPDVGDEAATLVGFLEFLRATLEWKCAGLDAAGLAATVGPSTMTLGGLLKHMAWVEDHWFSCWLHDDEPAPEWHGVDWSADPDWEWHSAAADRPDELRTIWRDAVTRSRALVEQALATGDAGQLARRTGRDGRRVTLRWILCHMVEEYARHNGHADLIREAVDGATGE